MSFERQKFNLLRQTYETERDEFARSKAKLDGQLRGKKLELEDIEADIGEQKRRLDQIEAENLEIEKETLRIEAHLLELEAEADEGSNTAGQRLQGLGQRLLDAEGRTAEVVTQNCLSSAAEEAQATSAFLALAQQTRTEACRQQQLIVDMESQINALRQRDIEAWISRRFDSAKQDRHDIVHFSLQESEVLSEHKRALAAAASANEGRRAHLAEVKLRKQEDIVEKKAELLRYLQEHTSLELRASTLRVETLRVREDISCKLREQITTARQNGELKQALCHANECLKDLQVQAARDQGHAQRKLDDELLVLSTAINVVLLEVAKLEKLLQEKTVDLEHCKMDLHEGHSRILDECAAAAKVIAEKHLSAILNGRINT